MEGIGAVLRHTGDVDGVDRRSKDGVDEVVQNMQVIWLAQYSWPNIEVLKYPTAMNLRV